MYDAGCGLPIAIAASMPCHDFHDFLADARADEADLSSSEARRSCIIELNHANPFPLLLVSRSARFTCPLVLVEPYRFTLGLAAQSCPLPQPRVPLATSSSEDQSNMSGFANSFWSNDYAGGKIALSRRDSTPVDISGLGVLFGKLQQGVQENQQVLTIARMRAEAEELYGQQLAAIAPASDKIPGGFQRDDGASVRKAYEGVRTEMDEASKNHRKIASNIRELVVNPFSRWCEDHANRVQNSQDDLQTRIKLHDKQAELVRKYRSQYYNKCRLVEDVEEEDKLAFQDPRSEAAQSPKIKAVPAIKEPEPVEEEEPIDIGDRMLYPDQVKKILIHMLANIKLGETKVPILGTYPNTSTGADITNYVQKYMEA